jgi:hypothetical protein
MFITKTFYSSGGSYDAAERQYHQRFPVCAAPLRNTIFQIVKQFEKTRGM